MNVNPIKIPTGLPSVETPVDSDIYLEDQEELGQSGRTRQENLPYEM